MIEALEEREDKAFSDEELSQYDELESQRQAKLKNIFQLIIEQGKLGKELIAGDPIASLIF